MLSKFEYDILDIEALSLNRYFCAQKKSLVQWQHDLNQLCQAHNIKIEFSSSELPFVLTNNKLMVQSNALSKEQKRALWQALCQQI